jgi:hypothetical protein
MIMASTGVALKSLHPIPTSPVIHRTISPRFANELTNHRKIATHEAGENISVTSSKRFLVLVIEIAGACIVPIHIRTIRAIWVILARIVASGKILRCDMETVDVIRVTNNPGVSTAKLHPVVHLRNDNWSGSTHHSPS